MKFEYLFFNLAVSASALAAVIFYPKMQKLKLRSVVMSIIVPGIVFVATDVFVTDLFWYFNSEHILGIFFLTVPVEEILFFITVPFGCLVLWVNWKKLSDNRHSIRSAPLIFAAIAVVLATVSFSLHLSYTSFVLAALLLCIIIDGILRTRLFRKLVFLQYLGIVSMLTFIFNLYLTARPVVTYNLLMKTNLQVATIPLEDFVYGVVLVSFVVILYEYMEHRSA
jgi:lycopene cyclase domain-containing protein